MQRLHTSGSLRRMARRRVRRGRVNSRSHVEIKSRELKLKGFNGKPELKLKRRRLLVNKQAK
jgi:type III secretory pathway component EscU